MSIIATAIKFMRAGGMSEAAILEAVEALEEAKAAEFRGANELPPRDEAAERRRAYDRERQKTKREEAKKSADNPRTSADNPKPHINISSKEEDLFKEGGAGETKTDNPPTSADKSKRARQLPPDWEPSPREREYARGLGLSDADTSEVAENVRLWARSKGAKYIDWEQMFMGCLRREAKSRKPKSAAAYSGPQTDPPDLIRVSQGDPRWEFLAERFKREHGHYPPNPRNGWLFKREWLDLRREPPKERAAF